MELWFILSIEKRRLHPEKDVASGGHPYLRAVVKDDLQIGNEFGPMLLA